MCVLIQTEHLVGAGELAEVLQRSSVVRSGCISFVDVVTKLLGLATYLDGRSPAQDALIPARSLESRGSEGSTTVLLVLSIGDHTEVGPPVIQAISIDVIDLETLNTGQEAVHQYARATYIGDGIPMVADSLGTPCMTLNEGKILIVQGHPFTLRQGYVRHGHPEDLGSCASQEGQLSPGLPGSGG